MSDVEFTAGDATTIPDIMPVMRRAFDPAFGEAWNEDQCLAMMSLPSTSLWIARQQNLVCGFAMTRSVLDEMELLLIAVDPAIQRRAIGRGLLERVLQSAQISQVKRLFLEVRQDNPAIKFYENRDFERIGIRPGYYSGHDGQRRDACTYALAL